MSSLLASARSQLKKRLDWDNEEVDAEDDLNEIAKSMSNWEFFPLELTGHDINEIKMKYPLDLALQK